MFRPFKRRKSDGYYGNWVDASKEGLKILRGDIVQIMIHPFPIWSKEKYRVIALDSRFVIVMNDTGRSFSIRIDRVILYKRNSFSRF